MTACQAYDLLIKKGGVMSPVDAAVFAWNACRAAMLQAQSSDDGEPTDDERIMAIEGINNCERCGDEGWIVGEMGITRCACSQGGTLTSDGTIQVEPVTTANKLGSSPVQSPIDHGYRKGCECSGCKTTVRICAELAGWTPVSERMPEDEQEVLTINRMGHRFVSFFDKHSGLFFDRLDAPAACCLEHVLVTHWMPLPAAPQEVKNV
ncbi:TPA: DUF551 domain-containing protein [Klebsiella aerogenes]|nr:DUF551 domain-containing protein [Klebsiella aerogenes]